MRQSNKIEQEVYQDLETRLSQAMENRKTVEFNQYQEFVKTMKVYPEKHAIVYPALGIAGEGGEIAEKVKKWLRGDRELDKTEVAKELGDVCWYIASMADDLGFTLQQVIQMNVEKLTSRKERGVQKGDGDNR